MALLVAEGFDDAPSGSHIMPYYTNRKYEARAKIDYTDEPSMYQLRRPGKFSGYSLGTVFTAFDRYIFRISFNPRVQNTIIVAFDLYTDSYWYSKKLIRIVGTGDKTMLRLEYDNYSAIILRDHNNNILGNTPPGVLYKNDFSWLSIKITANPTAGLVEIKNAFGDTIFSYTGNTLGAADSSEIESVYIGNHGSFVDNLIICDTTGTIFNDHLTDHVILTLLPNGPGDVTQWSATGAPSVWEAIDEQSGNGDTDYASTNQSLRTFLVNVQDLPHQETNYKAIAVLNRVRRDDSGLWYIRNKIKTGGNEYEGPEFGVDNSNYLDVVSFWVNNPSTGSPWTATEIDALQIGAKSRLA